MSPPSGRTDSAGGAAAPRPFGVWMLAWPSMLHFALQSLVGFVDLIFVGSLGARAVAAVGVAAQLHFLVFGLLAAVTTGTVALVAREMGAGNRAEAGRLARASVLMAGLLAALLMLAIPRAEAIVSWMGVEAPVAGLGGRCLAILLAFNVPFAVAATVAMALRGAGDVRTPLLIGAVTNAVNVLADYAFIFGRLGSPELGAPGSALASGLAFVVGMGLSLALWLRGDLALPTGAWRGCATWARSRRLLRVGIPTALEQTSWSLGLLLFLGLVARFGTEPVSAYLIGVRILSLCFVPGLGYSTAAATLVGQHLGAGRPAAATRSGWRATAGAVAAMGSVGLAITATARPLAGLFGATGAETVGLTVTFIHILGAAQPLMAVEFALAGALRGAGDTRFPLFALLAGLFGFRLAAARFVAIPLFEGVVAVWLCLLADYAVKASLLGWRFRSGRWQQLRV